VCKKDDREISTVILNRGVQKISGGAQALTCSTSWKVFERECVPSKCYASANVTPLHVILFTSGRDGSPG